MTDSRLETAALNNALWCDAVCDAQGHPGEFLDDVWLNRSPTPLYYPNVVTLSAGARSAAQIERVWGLIRAGLAGNWSVKDSFAALDLEPLGFQVAFKASWLWRDPRQSAEMPDAESEDVRWRPIQAPDGLRDWEAAWAEKSPAPRRIFLPDLLEQSGGVFLAAYQAQKIVAGVIANRTDDVVGISNVFVPPEQADRFWQGGIHAVEAIFPGLAMVDYERGDDLLRAQALGFEAIGPLMVWERKERK